jgi:two-component system, cell cycle sensor histidine kinase and response regulator CckA
VNESSAATVGIDRDSILIVNDVSDQLDMMSMLLRQAGYKVFTAENGLEGLSAAQELRPRLIISDVAMPHLDGIEMTRLIRADAGIRLIPVLLVSANRRDTQSAVEGLRAGADDYLEAPYEPMRLIAQAARMIERARLEEMLRQSEERYRLLFEHNPQAMWVFDAETLDFLAVNNAAIHHYGYSREEFLSMTIKDIRPPEDVPALLDDVALNTLGMDKAGVWRHRKKDGTIIDVEISSYEVDFADRKAKLVLAYDVTERLRAEQTLKETAEQLRQTQKLEAIGSMAGGVAHDFNNILTAITGYSDLTLRGLDENDPLCRNVQEIKRAAERAASLTQQLLAFSRKQVMQLKILNLNDVVSEMDRMFKPMIGEDVDYVITLDPAIGQVKADKGQVEQVLMNLVVNARDAMPRGGKLTIETKNIYLDKPYASHHLSVTPGPYVMLAVSDTGMGMDEATKARIFEPFFTTKEAGKGTGLGLSTVYGIVKQLGGNIWVYSEPGHGTTFKIYFPLIDDEAGTVLGQTEIEAPRGTETVLLVEDDDAIRELIREILEMEGYKVLTASSGHEALQVSQEIKDSIELLITDVVMPGMSGGDLSKTLAETYPEIKVLYMSGYTDDAVVRHGVLEEGTAFLQKPFSPDSLAHKVRAVLDG